MSRQLTLRELITERILFACSDEDLQEMFDITAAELPTLGDLDLFELYEEVIYQSN